MFNFFDFSFLNVNMLRLAYSLIIVNWISSGWGQNKTFEDAILGFGKILIDTDFSQFADILYTQTIDHLIENITERLTYENNCPLQP